MEQHEKSTDSGKLRQFLAVLAVNLSSIVSGIMLGWQSPVTPQLQSSPPAIGTEPMTDDAVSWLSSILSLSGAFMIMLLSVIPDKFSRKTVGYLVAIPLGISWLLIIFANEQTYLFVARALGGIGSAGTFFLVPNYVSEISSDSIRGVLGSILVFCINLGILLGYVLGMLSIRDFAIIALGIVILYAIAIIFIPESPFYLVRQNRMEEAAKSLTWLKAGNTYMAEQTLSYLQAKVKELDVPTKSAKLSDLFRDKATVKALIITLALFISQQFSGIIVMINYAEAIFKLSGSSLSPNMAAITVGAIQLFGSILSSVLVERAGRRPLVLISCAGMCACHFAIGTYCYLQDLGYNVSDYGWLPVTAMSTFMVVYALGMAMAPIVMMAEVFSQDVSSLGSTVSLCVLWFTAFLVVKIFPDLLALVGIYGCFYLFAGSCAVSFLFFSILLPETKGRVREDIVEELNGRREKSAKELIGMNSVQAEAV